MSMGDGKPHAAIGIWLPAADSPQWQVPGYRHTAATIHNLKRLDLRIPGQGLTVLCGVSGSGKSTLLHRVIHESALAGRPVNCAAGERTGSIQAESAHLLRANPVRTGSERLG